MRRAPGRVATLAALAALAAGACTEDVTAPGQCPASAATVVLTAMSRFCPNGQITVVDSVLGASIERDSAFRGFVLPHEAAALRAADFPTLDSRPIFRTLPIAPRVRTGSDTTTGPVTGVDSVELRVIITARDTAAHNLTLRFFPLPLPLDTTFADLAGPFGAAPPVRTVNVESLLAQPGLKDPVTGDSVVVDTVARTLELIVSLDSAQAPYVPADSGQLAFGVRVSADSLAGIALGSVESGLGPRVIWYLKVDSLGNTVHRTQARIVAFDSFVFDPPPAALDANLAVGGAPSARSLLRVNLPRFIRDSAQIIRATLILVPAVAAQGVPADSFVLAAHAVEADFGAKSPLAGDPNRVGTATVRIGSTDTVRVELTQLLRLWAQDTLAATAVMLRQQSEGGSFAEIRFHPSANAAFRPALHLTYVPRFPFGSP